MGALISDYSSSHEERYTYIKEHLDIMQYH